MRRRYGASDRAAHKKPFPRRDVTAAAAYYFPMTATEWVVHQQAFIAAAGWFAAMAPQGSGRWNDPGLGEWTVRDLTGHTARSMLNVETYLGQSSGHEEIASPAEYFRRALASADDALVAQRGRDAGAALGADPATAVAGIAERVTVRVAAADADATVATPFGRMTLANYLPTRTFELTIHTCDFAVAVGVQPSIPALAAEETFTLLGRLALDGGKAAELLLAATGRRVLPSGYTVL